MAGDHFGYPQELNRTMGGFSSFAVSFSLISVLTGLYANFSFGFREVGGWIVWSWAMVAAGQYLIARVMAALSVRFPIAGYGYQWTARLVNPHFGFFVGWMLLAQFMTGFPGIAQTAAVTIASSAGLAVGPDAILMLTLFIISVVAMIHLWGIRIASTVNDAGVYAELAGVALLILMLTWSLLNIGVFEPKALTTGLNHHTGTTPGWSSLAPSLLLGAWCLTGFEAAADLAEETRTPEKTVPKAVVNALVSAAVAGFIILTLLVSAVGDAHEIQKAGNPLNLIIENSIGPTMAAVINIFVIISILACAVASMATASRLLFSMARDRMLPVSGWLARVNPVTRTPQGATVAVWVLSGLSVVLFRKIEVITSVSALASFIGYAGIMYACCRRGGGWLPAAAMIWALAMVAALALPETEVAGFNTKHLPALSAAVVLAGGAIVYLTGVRKGIQSGESGPPQNINNPTEH